MAHSRLRWNLRRGSTSRHGGPVRIELLHRHGKINATARSRPDQLSGAQNTDFFFGSVTAVPNNHWPTRTPKIPNPRPDHLDPSRPMLANDQCPPRSGEQASSHAASYHRPRHHPDSSEGPGRTVSRLGRDRMCVTFMHSQDRTASCFFSRNSPLSRPSRVCSILPGV